MMQDEIVDILLRAGIPASTKGFTYIHDALELMDRDSYYFSGQVCALYAQIAKQNGRLKNFHMILYQHIVHRYTTRFLMR